jgi:N-acetylneuraminic acid mutarotase
MLRPRNFGQSVRLADGRVLVAGGMTLDNEPVRSMMTSVEIFNPATNSWTAAADLSQARYAHVLVLLPNGLILVMGGARDYDCCWTENSFVREIEVYHPAVNRWHTAGEFLRPAIFAVGTVLPDDRVWITGGQGTSTGSASWQDTWLINPMPANP